MRLPRVRFTVRRLMIAVAVVVVVLAGIVENLVRPIRSHLRAFARVEVGLKSLQHKRPPEVSRQRWAYVVGWTRNANANCCSFRGSVDPPLLEDFADKLDRKLRGRVDMGTIDWIWDELVRISRVGKSYDRYRPTRPDRLEEADKGFTWAGVEVE